nr:MAG TPA: hypothetical protein [Caudoviricetes sp.]
MANINVQTSTSRRRECACMIWSPWWVIIYSIRNKFIRSN